MLSCMCFKCKHAGTCRHAMARWLYKLRNLGGGGRGGGGRGGEGVGEGGRGGGGRGGRGGGGRGGEGVGGGGSSGVQTIIMQF